MKDGVTGFHMGKIDANDLVPQDVASIAAAVKRCEQRPEPTTNVAFLQQICNARARGMPCAACVRATVGVPEYTLRSPGALEVSNVC